VETVDGAARQRSDVLWEPRLLRERARIQSVDFAQLAGEAERGGDVRAAVVVVAAAQQHAVLLDGGKRQPLGGQMARFPLDVEVLLDGEDGEDGGGTCGIDQEAGSFHDVAGSSSRGAVARGDCLAFGCKSLM